MQFKLSTLLPVHNNRLTMAVSALSFISTFMLSGQILADSQFSEKSIAVIQSCDAQDISGFATLKERVSDEGVKELDVFMLVDGLSPGKHGVHIHETASCQPCGSAGGHFDPGNFGMSNPDANHPFHAGDLINIESDSNMNAVMTTQTSRVTLSDGPMSIHDSDGSAFIVHVDEDTYCPEGHVAGCAGGARAACGIINRVNLVDDFELFVSGSSNRSNAVELSRAELTNSAFIFLSPILPSTPIDTVTFYLDGEEIHTEFHQPYDFRGTYSNNTAAGFDTRGISDGTHNLAAEIKLISGESTFVSAEFRVDNDPSSFSNGSENK